MKKNLSFLWSQYKYIILLIGLGVLFRIVLFSISDPVLTKDATDPAGYISVAENISTGNYANYDGGRTPVYPSIISISNFNYKIVVIFQMIMGLAISILLYQIFLILYPNRLIAFFIGISFSLYLPFIHREILIATETTTIFFLTVTFYFFLLFLKKLHEEKLSYFLVFFTLTFAALTALTRPIYIILYYIILLAVIFLLILKQKKAKHFLISIILMVIPNLVLIQGWSYQNKSFTGIYAVSTWSGMSLSNKVGMFIESAPEEYAVLKKHYIIHRDKKIEKHGTHLMAAWLAFEDMQKETGLSMAELYDEIKQMSIETIKAEPALYLKGVVLDWFEFWKPIGFPRGSNKILRAVSNVQRVFFLFIIISFFVFLILYLFRRQFREKLSLSFIQITFIAVFYLLVLAVSGACAIIEIGNTRFSLITDPLMCLIVIFILYRTYIFYLDRGHV